MNFFSVVNNILQYKDGINCQITSPGYPGSYPNNANYTWIIRTGSQSANVAFRIIEMNINRWSYSYCDDYLEVNLKKIHNFLERMRDPLNTLFRALLVFASLLKRSAFLFIYIDTHIIHSVLQKLLFSRIVIVRVISWPLTK